MSERHFECERARVVPVEPQQHEHTWGADSDFNLKCACGATVWRGEASEALRPEYGGIVTYPATVEPQQKEGR